MPRCDSLLEAHFVDVMHHRETVTQDLRQHKKYRGYPYLGRSKWNKKPDQSVKDRTQRHRRSDSQLSGHAGCVQRSDKRTDSANSIYNAEWTGLKSYFRDGKERNHAADEISSNISFPFIGNRFRLRSPNCQNQEPGNREYDGLDNAGADRRRELRDETSDTESDLLHYRIGRSHLGVCLQQAIPSYKTR